MIGKCIFILICVSLLFSFSNQNMGELAEACIDGCSSAVSIVISMLGMMCLWCGVLEVLKKAGAISFLSRLMKPFFKFVFPDSGEARESMTAALCANILGIGNASTPLALRSMELLDRENPTPERPSRDMITFTVLATAPFSLMPTTVVTLLSSLGASAPFRVIVPVWISSAVGFLFAIFLCRAMGKVWRRG